MPVPSLPLDILDIVLFHLSESLDYCERHHEGLRIALVSKSWRKSGIAIAWKGIKVDLDEDGPLLRFLAGHASACEHVKNLVVGTTHDEGRPSQQAAENVGLVKQVFLACTCLDFLVLRTARLADLLSAAAQTTFAERFQHLEANVVDYPLSQFAILAQHLAAYSRVTILRLSVVDPEMDPMAMPDAGALKSWLSPVHVAVSLGSSRTSRQVLTAISLNFLALVTPRSLEKLTAFLSTSP
ncbi:hypothetical protein JCM11641_007251 [Rhodosporidiobolus odoratus]